MVKCEEQHLLTTVVIPAAADKWLTAETAKLESRAAVRRGKKKMKDRNDRVGLENFLTFEQKEDKSKISLDPFYLFFG